MSFTGNILWTRSGNTYPSSYEGVRVGWRFRLEPTVYSNWTVTARHEDGRTFHALYGSLYEAKLGAMDAMHPSEAMIWKADINPGSYRAEWDIDQFTADCRTDRGVEYRSTMRFGVHLVSGFSEARRMAVEDLVKAYPDNAPRRADGLKPVALIAAQATADEQRVADALTAARISFTPGQLDDVVRSLFP